MKVLLGKLLKAREITVVGFLFILFILVGAVNPVFLNMENIILTLKGSVMYVFLAIGMTFVIFTKDIDVSVGAILGMCAAVAATMLRSNKSLFQIIIVTLMIGAIAGLINGIGITKLKIPAIVMTLGTMGILRGLMFVYTGGRWVENLPDYFKNASQAELFEKINIFVLFTLITVVLIQLYLSKGKKGKYFAAIGDNIDGAVLIGIPVSGIRIAAFVISGICSAIAGLVYVSQVGFVANVAGSGTEMTAIAACVLGGVSLNGGIGSVVGAALGAVIMNSINTALVFLKVPAYWNNTISGILLITIVVADAMIHTYLSEKARKERLSSKSMKIGEPLNTDRREING
ncbi:ABC transporter permease subunit [Geosporobacter ferrireducens]|uniref:ABC transporter permease subunit n=1 Tax=Geosporobacter ferrireducens TaxID=1424294 RepID=UPI000B0967B9|nr:ABC transporter permease [Geosporobacter ferrireducens]